MLNNSDLHSIAHAFRPRQLTLARELRGLLKHELAAKIGKTPSAVGQFENGRARPDPSTIFSLGLALGVPAPFFAREPVAEAIRPDTCQFRSLRSCTVREQRYVVARAELLKELVAVLRSVGVRFPDLRIPHASRRIGSRNEIEMCAEKVRSDLGLRDGPLPNLVNEVENAGVIIVPMDAQCRRIDAFSTWIEGTPFIFMNTYKGSTSRSRFDIAHELGHLVMHADVEPGSKELERQADAFASAFLLPATAFVREIPKRLNFDHLRELKRRWKVSIASILYRAHTLGAYSDATLRRAYMTMNRLGIRNPEPDEPAAEEPNLLKDATRAVLGEPEADLARTLRLSQRDVEALVQGEELSHVVAA